MLACAPGDFIQNAPLVSKDISLNEIRWIPSSIGASAKIFEADLLIQLQHPDVALDFGTEEHDSVLDSTANVSSNYRQVILHVHLMN